MMLHATSLPRRRYADDAFAMPRCCLLMLPLCCRLMMFIPYR